LVPSLIPTASDSILHTPIPFLLTNTVFSFPNIALQPWILKLIYFHTNASFYIQFHTRNLSSCIHYHSYLYLLLHYTLHYTSSPNLPPNTIYPTPLPSVSSPRFAFTVLSASRHPLPFLPPLSSLSTFLPSLSSLSLFSPLTVSPSLFVLLLHSFPSIAPAPQSHPLHLSPLGNFHTHSFNNSIRFCQRASPTVILTLHDLPIIHDHSKFILLPPTTLHFLCTPSTTCHDLTYIRSPSEARFLFPRLLLFPRKLPSLIHCIPSYFAIPKLLCLTTTSNLR
jgi:hypothetical protein